MAKLVGLAMGDAGGFNPGTWGKAGNDTWKRNDPMVKHRPARGQQHPRLGVTAVTAIRPDLDAGSSAGNLFNAKFSKGSRCGPTRRSVIHHGGGGNGVFNSRPTAPTVGATGVSNPADEARHPAGAPARPRSRPSAPGVLHPRRRTPHRRTDALRLRHIGANPEAARSAV